MKHNPFNRILATMLTLVMTSMLITPVLAAAKYEETDKKPASKKNLSSVRTELLKSIKAQDGEKKFSPEELEQMRSALLELLDGVQESSTLLSPEARYKAGINDLGEPMTDDQSDDARTQIQNMSAQELTNLRKVLNPAAMRTKLAASRSTLNEYKNSLSKAPSETDNLGTLPGINSYCGAPVSSAAIIAADAVYFIAEGVRDIAQNVCNQVVLGANLRSGCNVTDAIYLVAKGVNQALHFCDDDYAASVGEANYARLGHIHDDIADVKANDNTNKDTIVLNDNTNKDTIVKNDDDNTVDIRADIAKARQDILIEIQKSKATIIADARGNKDELKNLLLRTQIEADLSSTDGSTFVALYETPSDKCFSSLNDKGLPQQFLMPDLPTVTIEQCGLLDLVRSIVQQTIANVGAGTNAQSFFATAESHRTAGRYKQAYASYRMAYKAAAK